MDGTQQMSSQASNKTAVHGKPMLARTALSILWPAFLVAGIQEALVFVVVDPHTLHWFGTVPIAWSVQAVYTVTFLIFWATTALAGALICLLLGAGQVLDLNSELR
jgi:uncharacterized membrane protein